MCIRDSGMGDGLRGRCLHRGIHGAGHFNPDCVTRTLITGVGFASSTAAKYSSSATLWRCIEWPGASLACSTPVCDNRARGSGRRGRRFKSCHPDQYSRRPEALPLPGWGLRFWPVPQRRTATVFLGVVARPTTHWTRTAPALQTWPYQVALPLCPVVSAAATRMADSLALLRAFMHATLQ